MKGNQLPESWKKYKVFYLLKPKKDPLILDSFRPIILSSVALKTLEIIIKNRIEWYLENKHHFSWSQTGFRKEQGTQNAQAMLTSEINLAFGENQGIMAIFLDIKSAYDNVNIYILYNKLIDIGIPSAIANVIFKILSDRLLFSINRNGSALGPFSTNTGLPQGSPLSTLLFNIYTRDLFFITPTQMKIIGYADDLVLLTKGNSPAQMKENISGALETITEWLSAHNLSLATSKCEPIWFSKNPKKVHIPPIKIIDTNIEFKNEVKYLGLILHKNLKWKPYIDHISIKAQKGINILKAICRVWWGADPKTLLMIHNGLVKSHLEYGSIFMEPCNKTHLKKIDTLQLQSLRIALGCMRSTPNNVTLAEAAEMNMDHRRKILAVNFLSKILTINNHPLTPLIYKIKALCSKNANYWRNKENPCLVQALLYFSPYVNSLSKSNHFPIFEYQMKYLIKPIKIINLGIHKDKNTQNQNFLKAIEPYRDKHILIYSDASKSDSRVGFGIHIPQIKYNFSSRLPNNLSICSAEVVAIYEAVRIVVKKTSKKPSYSQIHRGQSQKSIKQT